MFISLRLGTVCIRGPIKGYIDYKYYLTVTGWAVPKFKV